MSGRTKSGQGGGQARQPGLVALVGRPNVGKSALFNRLAGRRIAIVHDQPGVTRDRITARCNRTSPPCTVMDTGGIGANLEDEFAAQVRAEADIALATAGLVLFLVDGAEGLQPVDRELAAMLRRSKAEVVLVVNKVDEAAHLDRASEFAELGFAQVVATSAEHGRGIPELVALIDTHLDQAGVEIDPADAAGGAGAERTVKLALAGRPNAGKSSLVNALLGDERTIVSPVSGTTRDSVDIPWQYGDQHYVLIDTAGIRRRSKMDEAVEVFSSMRSQRAIERADIVALVIDCAAGVTAQDRRVARMILDANRPCVIVANKFDLFHPGASRSARLEEIKEEIRRELFFLDYAPVLACSALEKDDTRRLHGLLDKVRVAAQKSIGTGQLNRLLQQAMTTNPPPLVKGRRFKLYYATVVPDDRHPAVPLPRFLLFVNEPALLLDSYQRFLENTLRQQIEALGLPLKLIVKARQRRE